VRGTLPAISSSPPCARCAAPWDERLSLRMRRCCLRRNMPGVADAAFMVSLSRAATFPAGISCAILLWRTTDVPWWDRTASLPGISLCYYIRSRCYVLLWDGASPHWRTTSPHSPTTDVLAELPRLPGRGHYRGQAGGCCWWRDAWREERRPGPSCVPRFVVDGWHRATFSIRPAVLLPASLDFYGAFSPLFCLRTGVRVPCAAASLAITGGFGRVLRWDGRMRSAQRLCYASCRPSAAHKSAYRWSGRTTTAWWLLFLPFSGMLVVSTCSCALRVPLQHGVHRILFSSVCCLRYCMLAAWRSISFLSHYLTCTTDLRAFCPSLAPLRAGIAAEDVRDVTLTAATCCFSP